MVLVKVSPPLQFLFHQQQWWNFYEVDTFYMHAVSVSDIRLFEEREFLIISIVTARLTAYTT